jgi:hypothetical protein
MTVAGYDTREMESRRAPEERLAELARAGGPLHRAVAALAGRMVAFFEQVTLFENMVVRSGIRLIEYWFEVSFEEQQRRFRGQMTDPTKHWKLRFVPEKY